MVKEIKNNEIIINDMYNEISDIITNNKNKMIYQINNTLVETNFMIGKIIVGNEQNGNIRAKYGKEILSKLSKKLTNRFGSGYSSSSLICVYFIINLRNSNHWLEINKKSY